MVCESTHLTPFTLLLDPYPRQHLADMDFPLTIVGSLGSALSVLGLTLTIITYKFFSRWVYSVRIQTVSSPSGLAPDPA